NAPLTSRSFHAQTMTVWTCVVRQSPVRIPHRSWRRVTQRKLLACIFAPVDGIVEELPLIAIFKGIPTGAVRRPAWIVVGPIHRLDPLNTVRVHDQIRIFYLDLGVVVAHARRL